MSYTTWARDMGKLAATNGNVHFMPYRGTKFMNSAYKKANRAQNVALRAQANAERANSVREKPNHTPPVNAPGPYTPRDLRKMSLIELVRAGIIPARQKAQ